MIKLGQILSRSLVSSSHILETMGMSLSLKLQWGRWSMHSLSGQAPVTKKKAPGLSSRKSPKSSLPLKGSKSVFTLSAPNTAFPTLMRCSVQVGWLLVRGVLILTISQSYPSAFIFQSSSSTFPIMRSPVFLEKARMVPQNSTLWEMTLQAEPELRTGNMQVRGYFVVSLTHSAYSIRVWQSLMVLERAYFRIYGSEPCPPVPVMVIYRWQAMAMKGPGRMRMCPKLWRFMLWKPYTSSTPYRQPSLIMRAAPSTIYQAGWKRHLTLRLLGMAERASMICPMKPIRQVVWPSWPHMWAASFSCDLQGSSGLFQFMRRASMSALMRMQQGWPLGCPVPGMSIHRPGPFLSTIMPGSTPISATFSLILAVVRCSCQDISGCWCRSRLNSTSPCLSSAASIDNNPTTR